MKTINVCLWIILFIAMVSPLEAQQQAQIVGGCVGNTLTCRAIAVDANGIVQTNGVFSGSITVGAVSQGAAGTSNWLVSVATSVLPTGAATSVIQTNGTQKGQPVDSLGNTFITDTDDGVIARGQRPQLIANELYVDDSTQWVRAPGDNTNGLKVQCTMGCTSTGGTSSTVGSAVPSTGTYVGFSDGTNMQGPRVFDEDSGAGTQYVAGTSIRTASSGGSVEVGSVSDAGQQALFSHITNLPADANQGSSPTTPPVPMGCLSDTTTAIASGQMGYIRCNTLGITYTAGFPSTVTDKAGSVTTGGTSQTAVALNAARRCVFIENYPDSTTQGISIAENLFISVTGASSTTTGAGIHVLTPGGIFSSGCSGGPVTTQAVTVTAATTGHKFGGWEQ